MSFIGESFRRVSYLLNRDRVDAELRREMEDTVRRWASAAVRQPAAVARGRPRRVGWGWLDHLVRPPARHSNAAANPRIHAGRRDLARGGLCVDRLDGGVLNATCCARSRTPKPIGSTTSVCPARPWEPGNIQALDWRSVEDVVEFPITAAGDTFYVADGGSPNRSRPAHRPRLIEGLGVGRCSDDAAAPDFKPSSDRVALMGYACARSLRIRSVDSGTADPRRTGDRRPRRVVPDRRRAAARFLLRRDSSARADLVIPLTEPRRTYMVRLREGCRPVREQRLTEAARSVATGLPAAWSGCAAGLFARALRRTAAAVLTGITIAAGLVLVVVCANLAVLMVLRAVRRHKRSRCAPRSARSGATSPACWPPRGVLCVSALALGLLITEWVLRGLAPVIETELGRPAQRHRRHRGRRDGPVDHRRRWPDRRARAAAPRPVRAVAAPPRRRAAAVGDERDRGAVAEPPPLGADRLRDRRHADPVHRLRPAAAQRRDHAPHRSRVRCRPAGAFADRAAKRRLSGFDGVLPLLRSVHRAADGDRRRAVGSPLAAFFDLPTQRSKPTAESLRRERRGDASGRRLFLALGIRCAAARAHPRGRRGGGRGAVVSESLANVCGRPAGRWPADPSRGADRGATLRVPATVVGVAGDVRRNTRTRTSPTLHADHAASAGRFGRSTSDRSTARRVLATRVGRRE